MRRSILWAVLLTVILLTSGCQPPVPRISFPKIDRQPVPFAIQRQPLSELPHFSRNPGDLFDLDLRSADLSGFDLRESGAELPFYMFDSLTRWPDADLLPARFDPAELMEKGKDPGLGVRALHEEGITGAGVGIAIIDQTLLVDHAEYASRLQFYEEYNFPPDAPASMHGPAVASLAVGQTSGAAPGADLYFIASWFTDPDGEVNFNFLAQAIDRILEINRALPKGQRIRVISISRGLGEKERGYAEVMAAIERAEKAGIPVISVMKFGSTSTGILGLGRDVNADPDLAHSYAPALFYQDLSWLTQFEEQLWIPIDNRTTANLTGPRDFVYYPSGGLSWAEPYLAGVYALACQVQPDITADEFWELARATGEMITVERDGQSYEIGPVIQPYALIHALGLNE